MNKKGFTLIEVLIVVVIIAVLASLLLPRMAAQTECAIAAEGLQTLGVIRRAQEQRAELSGNWVAVAANANFPAALGITIGNNTRFNYTCAVNNNIGTCTATRTNDNTRTISVNSNGIVVCGAGYTAVRSDNRTVGCA
ncbi:MAG TPA: prepilin-type N-terminal cleavage/methylation domain-containing protein [Candidatus Omnitrophota bacterium]|nr:prepilin-type N-terminal cleavage/methylation domain-containing protein [Candidatus Omnitrophota bacterium]